MQFPSFISPEIIQGFPVRWYGLMYVFAFSTAFLIYRRQVIERRFPMSEEMLSSMFLWCVAALILGARIFSIIVYNPQELTTPWRIFWPFEGGRFVGLQGMSYHGGAIGGVLGIVLWSKRNRYDLREIGDMFGCAIPLGYTFGRLGNFFNQELYGRVTDGPLGMIFPLCDERFSPNLGWVREIAEKSGIAISNGALVNLPRYPTQLFEAFFEGIVLFAIMWLLRKHKPFKGFLFGAYLFCYGLIRFLLEYLREPDAHLGYRIQFGEHVALRDIAHLHPLTSLSTGQLLSLGMMVFSAIFWLFLSRSKNRQPIYYYDEESGSAAEKSGKSVAEKKSVKNARRKLRKKLK
jgi:phosphatidylglycerol:prolipoprotein diacylglycerol transferase